MVARDRLGLGRAGAARRARRRRTLIAGSAEPLRRHAGAAGIAWSRRRQAAAAGIAWPRRRQAAAAGIAWSRRAAAAGIAWPRRRQAAAAAVALALLAIAGCGSASQERFAAASVLPGAPAAPDFALRDAGGRRVRLSDFRGRAVLLTFLYVNCPDVCPLTVERVRAGLARLGTRAERARLVVVSVDPRGDTPAAVRAFVRAHRAHGWLTYLRGSRSELAQVWKRYGVAVLASPEDREVGHSSLVVGIDASGRQRVQFAHDFTAAQIAHDVPVLAGAG